MVGSQSVLLDGNNDYASRAENVASTEIDNISFGGWLRWTGNNAGSSQIVFINGNTN